MSNSTGKGTHSRSINGKDPRQESSHLIDMMNLANESHGTRQFRQQMDLDPVSMSPNPEMGLRDEMNYSADGNHGTESVDAPGEMQGDGRNGLGDDELEEDGQEFRYEKMGTFVPPPSIAEAEEGLTALKVILKPPRKNGPGYEHHGLDELTYSRLVAMKGFLWKYIRSEQTTCWVAASLEVA